MSKLEVALLGSPQVRRDGTVLSFKTRKTLALLALLAVEGRAQSRERLTAMFWPESDPDAAHTSMRGALHYLHLALGDEGHLAITRDAVGLALKRDDLLDFRALEQAAGLADRPGDRTDDETATLEAAANLWRGDFLEGFSLPDAPAFDEWAALHAQSARRDATRLVRALHAHHLKCGHPGVAVDWAQRWLAIEPLDEGAYRGLMQAHHLAGDRSAAARAYATCQTVLRREVGADPSPETQALAHEIERSALEGARGAPVSWTLRPPRLVGREAAWAELEEAWAGGRIAFISGEPGVGKTRLLGDFARSKGEVLRLDGRPGDAGVPYAALARFWTRVLDDRPNLELPEWVRGELARIVPALGGVAPPPPESGHLRLLEALAAATRLVTRGIASILCDDFHLLDAASLEASAYIIADLQPFAGEGATRAICAYRSGELRKLHAATISRLVDGGLAVDVSLRPLEEAAVADLLADLGTGRLAGLAPAFTRYTGGNPLFVVETVRHLLESGRLNGSTGPDLLERLAPTGRVGELVRRRLERLSGPALGAARVAAVLGEDFAVEDAASILETKALELATPLAELERAQVLRGDRFSHDVVRETVLATMPEPVRRFLHGRALAILTRDGTRPAVLARHAEGAADHLTVFSWSLKAGEEAIRVQSLGDAVPHYERALRAARQSGAPVATDEQLEGLLDRLAQTHWYLGNLDRAREVYEEALAFARSSGRARFECTVLNRLAALAASRSNDLAAAASLLREALRIAREIGEGPGIATVGFRAWMARRFWFREASLADASDALAMARTLNSPELTAGCLLGLAILKGLHLGLCDEAERQVEEARSLFLATRDQAMEVDCLCALVAARVQGGRARAAVDAGRAALALSREIGNRQGEVLAGFVLTVALTEVGEYGAALELAERSVEVARAIGVPTARLTSLMGLGLARRAALALERAERALLEAHAVAVALASRPQVEMVAGSLCATHALQGDWPRAFGRAEHELGLRNYDWLPPATTPRWLVTEALLRGGAPARAAEDLRRLDEYASVNQRSVVPYLMAKSVLLEWLGENEAALELFLEARNSHGAVVPGEAWHLHSAVARLRAALGDAEGAASERRAAYAVTERLAASIGDAATRAHFTSRAAAIIGDP